MVKYCVFALLVALALVAVPAVAQQITGSISGAARDNTGAPLPGVTAEAPVVDVTQTNTQQNYNPDYLKKIPVGSETGHTRSSSRRARTSSSTSTRRRAETTSAAPSTSGTTTASGRRAASTSTTA